MSDVAKQLLDPDGIRSILSDMASKIHADRRPNVPIYLIGVRTRGYPIALRISESLKAAGHGVVPVGAVDITLYRDDLYKTERWPVLLGTEIPFEIDGADVVLIDDVLFTGRTIRAALNTICDLGRPARVQLAVLIDRGHREIPIQPDLVGLTVETRFEQRIRVRMQPLDATDEVLLVS